MKPEVISDWRVNVKEDGDESYPNGDPWKLWEDPVNQVVLAVGNQMRKSAFENSIDLSDTQMRISVGDRQFTVYFSLRDCEES
jgi:hypothetical protein